MRKLLVLTASVEASIYQIRLGVTLARLAADGGLAYRERSLKSAQLTDLLWADTVLLQRDKLLRQAPSRRQLMLLADGISVSTPRLQAALPPEVRARSFLTPAYATPADLPPTIHVQAGESSPVTLVLASSDAVPLATLLPALAALRAQPPVPLQLLVIGAMSPVLRAQWPDAMVSGRRSLAEFKRLLCGLSNPIGLIPLDESTFSACKSAVKQFDFAMCGIPSLCSAVPPYTDVMDPGVTGDLVPAEASAWRDAIAHWCVRADVRQSVALQAAARVADRHSLALNVQAWRQALASGPAGQPQTASRSPWITRGSLWLRLGLWQPVRAHVRRINEARQQQRRARHAPTG